MTIINLKYNGDLVTTVCATAIIGTSIDFTERNRLTIFTSGSAIKTKIPLTQAKFQEFNKIWQEAQLIPLVNQIEFDPYPQIQKKGTEKCENEN